MSIETVNVPAFVPMSEQAHFSQAVKAGGLLICSGAIGFDMATGGVPDDLADEFRNAFTMVGTLLEQEGLGFEDIVEMTTFHIDMPKTIGTFSKVRDEFLSKPYAAWTAIGISALALPTAHMEMRVIAQLK